MNSKTNNLRLGHVNIRSLLPSLNHVEELLTTVQLDILGTSETWLTSSVLNDRSSRGEGVGAYVRSGLQVKIMEIEEITEKQIWFSLKINQISISCGIPYRPTSFQYYRCSRHEVVIMGDLNIDLCKINNCTDLRVFNGTLETFDLNQIVIEPTACCGKRSRLLDVIALTNVDALLVPVTHVDLHEATNHQLTYCTVKINVPTTPLKLISYRDFNSFHATNFNSDLFTTIRDVVHIDQKVNILVSTILQLSDLHAPVRTVRVTRPKALRFTDALKIMKKHRNKLWSKYKKLK
nr:unnamed protein product [Callosobruchus analis]